MVDDKDQPKNVSCGKIELKYYRLEQWKPELKIKCQNLQLFAKISQG